MAKVSIAKAKISTYLKAKGLDAAEIKDAFDELDSADADLSQLADALQKNEQWAEWYKTASPEIQKIAQERDGFKAKLEKLQSAGLSFEEAKAVAQGAPNTPGQPTYMTKEEAVEFKQALAVAASDTMESLIRVNFKHFKEFGNEADLTALKELMKVDPSSGRPKAGTVDDAYRLWSEPEYEKKRQADTDKKISDGIKAGVTAQLSKQGFSRAKKTPAEKLGVENAPLDKPAPSDNELRQAFLADLDEETN